MSVKALLPDSRPRVSANPREARRLDPRSTYSRPSAARYVDRDGIIRVAPAGLPRLAHYDPDTLEYLGFLREPERVNLFPTSEGGSYNETSVLVTNNAAVAPDGTTTAQSIKDTLDTINTAHQIVRDFGGSAATLVQGKAYTYSFFGKPAPGSPIINWQARIQKVGTASYGAIANLSTGTFDSFDSIVRVHRQFYRKYGFWRLGLTFRHVAATASDYLLSGRLAQGTLTGYIGTGTGEVLIWGHQLEEGEYMTSYIPNPSTGSTARAADLWTFDNLNLPDKISVYIDARILGSSTDQCLLSAANDANTQTLRLRNQALLSSNVLAYNINGTFVQTYPMGVPVDTRERNIITTGDNKYHFRQDTARLTPSASNPTGLNRLGIGHDVVDPTKGVAAIINSVYLWEEELTPAVMEALVRGAPTPINADTYSPVGPADALALIINTQGSANDGSAQFTLPAQRSSVVATALVAGRTYVILTLGTTDFTLVGATANTVGTVFVATGPGTGTGTVNPRHDIVITWGDGTESGLEGSAAVVGAAGLVHDYPGAGLYPVWVKGQMDRLSFNNQEYAGDLVSISAWGTGEMFTQPRTMANAFMGCANLVSVPGSNIPDTSKCTDFSAAFYGCRSLASLPLFNTAAATNFTTICYDCEALTSIPAFNTSNVTNLFGSFQDCVSLAQFPQLDTSKVTNINYAWNGCNALSGFPLINTALVTTCLSAWTGCTSLASFPLLNLANCTSFHGAWNGCSGLTSFPNINVSKGQAFFAAWQNCAFTSFPSLNFASAKTMSQAWRTCYNLTSFPAIQFPSTVDNTDVNSVPGTGGFYLTWQNCTNLATFPANVFNNCTNTNNYASAFQGCALTALSIENILLSINTAGALNGTLGIQGGTNAAKTTWTTAANNAFNALVTKGWTITFNA